MHNADSHKDGRLIIDSHRVSNVEDVYTTNKQAWVELHKQHYYVCAIAGIRFPRT